MKESHRFAVIGRDITYSKSPDIFSAIFKLVGVDGVCETISIEPEFLMPELARLISEAYQGLAVTVPYKRTIVPFLDSVDLTASKIGSVNSVHFVSAKSVGYNTDWYGFTFALGRLRQLDSNSRVLIIGYGGSAAAILYSLSTAVGVLQINITGRSHEALSRFKLHFENVFGARIVPIDSSQAVEETAEFDLIVNCTPLGGWHMPDADPIPAWARVSRRGVYFDLNYNANNKTVKRLGTEGLLSVDGSAMLVAQAIRSYEIWTGGSVPFEPVYREVFGAAEAGKDA